MWDGTLEPLKLPPFYVYNHLDWGSLTCTGEKFQFGSEYFEEALDLVRQGRSPDNFTYKQTRKSRRVKV